MARIANPKSVPLVTVAGKVTRGVQEAIEEYRWANRKTVSDVISEAVVEFFTTRNIVIVEPVVEAPKADTEAPKADAAAKPGATKA